MCMKISLLTTNMSERRFACHPLMLGKFHYRHYILVTAGGMLSELSGDCLKSQHKRRRPDDHFRRISACSASPLAAWDQ